MYEDRTQNYDPEIHKDLIHHCQANKLIHSFMIHRDRSSRHIIFSHMQTIA